jgi:hypothetical protein
MKIAVTGASGQAGSEITRELSRRGHEVTAIAHPDRIADLANVRRVRGDVQDLAGLTRLWTGHDIAISAIHFLTRPRDADRRCEAIQG